jgi:hypothetical protein
MIVTDHFLASMNFVTGTWIAHMGLLASVIYVLIEYDTKNTSLDKFDHWDYCRISLYLALPYHALACIMKLYSQFMAKDVYLVTQM